MVAQRSTYSVRLFRPFAKTLAARYGVNEESFQKLLPFKGEEERMPVSVAHDLLQLAVERTGDQTLGLLAGRAMTRGDGGAIDYAISTAATVRSALGVCGRYIHLMNDALEIRLEERDGLAIVHFDSQVVVPPVVEDFMVSSLYCRMFRALFKDVSKLECWLRRTAPVDTRAHEEAFAPAKLRFAAPSCGFVFAASALDEPLAEADANLHAVMRKYAEQLLEGMPQGPSFTARAREIILRHLAAGTVNIGAVARELHMSARTLGRRLEGEGTTFTDLVDDIRKRMAMRYVGTQSHALSEVAFMLGFAHPAAFHRAFKRWTGQTPLRYRSGHQLHA